MDRIVLFGSPGSGKSTIAKQLTKHNKRILVESSTSVIYPIANLFTELPKEDHLIAELKLATKRDKTPVSREMAMATYSRLKETYSPDVIAQILHELYVYSEMKKPVVFSGVRGLENAKYCRLHNDLVVYLKTDKQILIDRLYTNRGYTREQAATELQSEEKLYRTSEIEKIADIVIDTATVSKSDTAKLILKKLDDWNRMCKRCVNTKKNPSITFNSKGYCNICSTYIKHFDKKQLKKELDFLASFKGKGTGKHDVIVGISGGKDSTATLHTVNQMGFTPLAITLNLGYLPETTIPRARDTAALLGVNYEVIDVRHYVRDIDLESYKKTIKLYEEPFTLETKQAFKKEYQTGRKHYSVKCKHSPIFVRTCQLCRRMIIRSYYTETLKLGTNVMILGINEWTNLSAAQIGETYAVSGVRKLQPTKDQPPVYIFHLPFLLQRTSKQTKKILDKIGWEAPKGEDFIESNSNSCLYARSTERMAKRLLEFHPDSTRLAREVTVGFISKEQALKALKKIHPYKFTPRQVLERAGILKNRKN